jgi:hypothetical protein
LAGGGEVRAISAMVAAVVGVDDEAIVRVTTLKREWKGASLVLDSDMADMMKWGPLVYDNE